MVKNLKVITTRAYLERNESWITHWRGVGMGFKRAINKSVQKSQ